MIKTEEDNSDDDLVFLTSRPCEKVGFRTTSPTIKGEPGIRSCSPSMSPLTEPEGLESESPSDRDEEGPSPSTIRKGRGARGRQRRSNPKHSKTTSNAQPARQKRSNPQSSRNTRNATGTDMPSRRISGRIHDRGRNQEDTSLGGDRSIAFNSTRARDRDAVDSPQAGTQGPHASRRPTLYQTPDSGHTPRHPGQPNHQQAFAAGSPFYPTAPLPHRPDAFNTPETTPSTSSSFTNPRLQNVTTPSALNTSPQPYPGSFGSSTSELLTADEYQTRLMELDVQQSGLEFERKRLALLARKSGFNAGM